jgi:hypothetical protein
MVFIRILLFFLLAYIVGFILIKIIWRGISDLFFPNKGNEKATTFEKSKTGKKKFFDKEQGEFTDYEEIK